MLLLKHWHQRTGRRKLSDLDVFYQAILGFRRAGEQEGLKQTTVGVFCFGRAPGYDPKINPIVRVSALRLRVKLDLSYENEGKDDAVRIALPKGAYIPHFERDTESELPPKMPEPPLSITAAEFAPDLAVEESANWWMHARSAALVCLALMIVAACLAFFSVWQFPGGSFNYSATAANQPGETRRSNGDQLLPAEAVTEPSEAEYTKWHAVPHPYEHDAALCWDSSSTRSSVLQAQ